MSSVYHAGQLEVQARAGVQAEARQLGRTVRPTIPPVAQAFLRDQRVVLLGTVEPSHRVWASALTGPAGFARAEDERTVRIDARPAPGDPLLDDVRTTGVLGMLAIEFTTRRRMRLNGHARVDADGALVLQTEQVFANCPKYIQARDLDAEPEGGGEAAPSPRRAPALSDAQRAWIEGTDTLFIATAPPDGGADVSHRGGRPGFVRVEGPTRVVFPDYSGNNMFLTLGNIQANPRAGLLILDFEEGRTLQLTGRARVNWDPTRAAAFPGAQRLVEFDVEEAVESALPWPLRWRFLGYSPFNPDPPAERACRGAAQMTSRTLLPRLMKSARAVVVAGLLVSGCATSDLGGPQVNTDQPTAAASAVAYRYANIEGRRVFYREAGSRNNPTIVFLHGFPTSSHMYRELIPLLADRFHVIAPDYIGFGHSDAPPVTEFRYTFDQLASVVDRLLGGLRVTRYILYVQDYGGPVGFRIAAAHPERVKGFVIQNANAYADGLSDAAKGFLFPLWKERSEKTLSAFRNLMTIDGTKFQYLTGTRDPARISPDTWTLDQALLDRPGSAERQLALFVDYEKNLALYETWHAYLRKHQPKTLVVWGKGDPFFTVAGAEAYRKDLRHIEVHYLNSGHFALEEDAPTIARHIKRVFAGRAQVSRSGLPYAPWSQSTLCPLAER